MILESAIRNPEMEHHLIILSRILVHTQLLSRLKAQMEKLIAIPRQLLSNPVNQSPRLMHQKVSIQNSQILLFLMRAEVMILIRILVKVSHTLGASMANLSSLMNSRILQLIRKIAAEPILLTQLEKIRSK